MAETPTTFKPYILPSSSQVREGATQGMKGGAVAGVTTAVLSTLFAWLMTSLKWGDFPVIFGREDFWSLTGIFCNTLPTVICCGMFWGLGVGGVTGVLSYFLITPWLPPELWPKLEQPLKRGLLVGSLIGGGAGWGLFVVAQTVHVSYLPDILFVNPFVIYGVCILLWPLGGIGGGFLNPFRAVVLPYLFNPEKEA